MLPNLIPYDVFVYRYFFLPFIKVIQWVYIGYSSKGQIQYIFLYSYTFKNEKPVVLDEVPFNLYRPHGEFNKTAKNVCHIRSIHFMCRLMGVSVCMVWEQPMEIWPELFIRPFDMKSILFPVRRKNIKNNKYTHPLCPGLCSVSLLDIQLLPSVTAS